MAKQRNYINGAFLNKSPKYEIIKMSFTEDFIENLKSLPTDAKGYRKVEMSAQKKDHNKWSIYEDTFKPGAPAGENGKDDLPF